MSTFDRIRQEPQFQQIRQIIRTNPHLLEQFIQQMSRENPELFRVRIFKNILVKFLEHRSYYSIYRILLHTKKNLFKC